MYLNGCFLLYSITLPRIQKKKKHHTSHFFIKIKNLTLLCLYLKYLTVFFFQAPASKPAEAQDGSVSCISSQAVSQQRNIWCQEEEDTLSEVRGVPADRVRRVPLLQRHEKVWWAGSHEAVLHHEAVHRSKS